MAVNNKPEVTRDNFISVITSAPTTFWVTEWAEVTSSKMAAEVAICTTAKTEKKISIHVYYYQWKGSQISLAIDIGVYRTWPDIDNTSS